MRGTVLEGHLVHQRAISLSALMKLLLRWHHILDNYNARFFVVRAFEAFLRLLPKSCRFVMVKNAGALEIPEWVEVNVEDGMLVPCPDLQRFCSGVFGHECSWPHATFPVVELLRVLVPLKFTKIVFTMVDAVASTFGVGNLSKAFIRPRARPALVLNEQFLPRPPHEIIVGCIGS